MAELVRITALLWLLVPAWVLIRLAVEGIDRSPPVQQAARLVVLGVSSLLMMVLVWSVLAEILRLVRP